MSPASLITAILLFLGMIICLELGFRLGSARRKLDPGSSHIGAGAIEGAVLALLGLILAFTFSGASSRLAERRQLIIREANSISSAYTRLDLLPAADQPELRHLFRQYLDARLAIYDNRDDPSASNAAAQTASRLQSQIWTRAEAATRGQNSALLVLPAINEMTDVTTARTLARQSRAPQLTIFLMVGLALLSALIAGYGIAPSGHRNLLLAAIFSFAISLTVYVVLDYDDPRSGLIRLSAAEQVLTQLRNTIQ